jgi:4-amino-4-deoxy-L-arabinose transferase-like glycosyltransferase
VLSILPLGSLPGQALWRWSPVGYGVAAVIVGALAALVFVGGPGSAPDGTTVLGATLAALLLAVASVLWARRRRLHPVPRHADDA